MAQDSMRYTKIYKEQQSPIFVTRYLGSRFASESRQTTEYLISILIALYGDNLKSKQLITASFSSTQTVWTGWHFRVDINGCYRHPQTNNFFLAWYLLSSVHKKQKKTKKRRKGIYSHSQYDMVAQVVRGALVVPLVPLDLEALPGQSVLMSPPVLVHPESP